MRSSIPRWTKLHIETALPFLKLGYDMLLEKPVTNNKKDLLMLKSIADRYGCKLMVCHVLRYTPFYLKIKEIVLSGEIGKIVEIESNEMVGVAHASASYIRGKWNNREKCGSSMLLAKCCHDMDLLCWFNSGTAPSRQRATAADTILFPKMLLRVRGRGVL